MGLAWESRGEGRPLVCLPWFGHDRTVMAAAMEPAWRDRTGWRRIYVDLPGCGGSPAGPETSDGVVTEVADFLDRVAGPEPVAVAGCSYGGYLAAALARRRPERIAGLLLICAGVKINRDERDVPPPTDPDPVGWLDDVDPEQRDHLSTTLGLRTRAVASRVWALLAGAPPGDDDYLHRLRANGYRLSDEDSSVLFSGPVSVLVGRRDQVTGYADQFRALAGYPHADYTMLDNAGHYLPLERPSQFRSAALGWLDRLDDAPL